MLVVATLSLKGGVGKTTVALGLAGAAHAHGVRTLVVDLDPQANATVALDAAATTATVADVLDDPTTAVVRRAIAPSGWGDGLDVLVGAEQTERHNRPDPGVAQLGRLLRAPLDRLRRPGRPARRALPAGDRRLPAITGPAHPQRARRRSAGPARDRSDDVRRGRGAARLRRDPGRARAGAWQPGPATAGRRYQPGAAAQQRARVPDRRAPRAVRTARSSATSYPTGPRSSRRRGHACRSSGGTRPVRARYRRCSPPARPCAADNPQPPGTGPDRPLRRGRPGRSGCRHHRHDRRRAHSGRERGTGRHR